MVPIILLSALLGWCGPFFGIRRPILGPDPNPGPDPDPIKKTFSNPMPGRVYSDPMPGIAAGIIGMLGGVGAGIAIHSLVPDISLGIISLAAFAGGKVLFDIVNGVRGR